MVLTGATFTEEIVALKKQWFDHLSFMKKPGFSFTGIRNQVTAEIHESDSLNACNAECNVKMIPLHKQKVIK